MRLHARRLCTKVRVRYGTSVLYLGLFCPSLQAPLVHDQTQSRGSSNPLIMLRKGTEGIRPQPTHPYIRPPTTLFAHLWAPCARGLQSGPAVGALDLRGLVWRSYKAPRAPCRARGQTLAHRRARARRVCTKVRASYGTSLLFFPFNHRPLQPGTVGIEAFKEGIYLHQSPLQRGFGGLVQIQTPPSKQPTRTQNRPVRALARARA
jgi:hypothetical protein